MWRAKAFRAIARVARDYPGKRFIYLTLTVKNCEVNKLGETLTWMNDSWQRLAERKEFPALGWLRSVEVTRSKDGTAHPHFHALLMVNSNYFTKGYLSQKRWRELWAESLRIDYDPQVDIKVVKPQKSTSTVTSETEGQESQPTIQPIDPGLEAAIRYTLKYSTKPDDYLSTDTSVSQSNEEYKRWLLAITKQLHKRKSVATGGIFKKYLSEEDPRNLIRDEGNVDTSETEEEDPRITYVWRDEVTQYLLKV
jgi:plasmid rolling circle replication initiator protein Rep